MGAWSDGLEQHCLEPVLYVIYTYNLSEGAIRLIGFILADARFLPTRSPRLVPDMSCATVFNIL